VRVWFVVHDGCASNTGVCVVASFSPIKLWYATSAVLNGVVALPRLG
jgi:hypothetical protein